ncbi:MAG: hypothetical protein ACOC2U_02460 [bacterium]
MKKVILLSGKINSGKNKIADFLKEQYESKGMKVSTTYFAKSLKNNCKEDFTKLKYVLGSIAQEIKNKIGIYVDNRTYMMNRDSVENVEKSIDKLIIKDENWFEDKTDITRNILQLYGTEIFRKRVDDDWWVNKVKKECEESDSDIIIVTDCRFPNEIEKMFSNEYKTITIRIERSINTEEHISQHDSEKALDDFTSWDYIVKNDGTIEDLNKSSVTIVEYIEKEKVEHDLGLFTRISNKENEKLSKILKEI